MSSIKKTQRITSEPSNADLYSKCWFNWVQLGKTPYIFGVEKDKGGLFRTILQVRKEGYEAAEKIIDLTVSKHHFSLVPESQKSAEHGQVDEKDEKKELPINTEPYDFFAGSRLQGGTNPKGNVSDAAKAAIGKIVFISVMFTAGLTLLGFFAGWGISLNVIPVLLLIGAVLGAYYTFTEETSEDEE